MLKDVSLTDENTKPIDAGDVVVVLRCWCRCWCQLVDWLHYWRSCLTRQEVMWLGKIVIPGHNFLLGTGLVCGDFGNVIVYISSSLIQRDPWIFQLLLGWSSPQFSFKMISTFRWIFQVALLFDFSAAWHRQTHWISRAAAGICLHMSCYLSGQLFICLSF